MALMYLFMQAWRCQDGLKKTSIRVPRFTYVAPTYKQAKDIAWDLLKSIVPPQLLLRRPNETNLDIRLTNRCIINLKGADKEDSLRGPGLYFVLLDEYQAMKPHIWPLVIQPELASTGGGALFIGTPDGRNHFYDAFKNGRDDGAEWKSWILPATLPTLNFDPTTPRGPAILAPGFLESVKEDVTQKFYEQEYECAFNDDAGLVFDRINDNVVDEFRDYPEAGHRYRIGFDPALREDWSVIAVVDLTDHKVKYVYRTNKIDAELLLSRIENESNKWTSTSGRPEIVMDTTGMGDPIYETLASRGLTITPVKFTNQTKREMVKNLALRFNKDQLKIPRYDWLIDELKDYRYTRSEKTGAYFYGAVQGKHDDGVTALMLAYWQIPPLAPILYQRHNENQGIFNRWTGVAH